MAKKSTSKIETGIIIDSVRPELLEIERAIDAISDRIGISSDIKIVPILQSTGKMAACNGWFSANRWERKNDGKKPEKLHELTITTETLNRPVQDIFETVWHEVVHFWCESLGVQDCAKSGRHNKKYQEHARNAGLNVPDEPGKGGFNQTSLTEESETWLMDVFAPDESVFTKFRSAENKKSRKDSKNKTVGFACEAECGNDGYRAVPNHKPGTCGACESQIVLRSSIED